MNWDQYAAVLIRLTWNYFRHCNAFLAWAGDVEATDAALWNSTSVVHWNADKRYLCDLEQAGTLAFSHAVVKRPAAGDFRVQEQFGGGVTPATPSPSLLRQVEAVAEAVTRIAPGPLLYARIDGVVSHGPCPEDGTFLVMEVELIEPSLFLDGGDNAASRFVEVIVRQLSAIEPDHRYGLPEPL